jgi:hypothetical protein
MNLAVTDGYETQMVENFLSYHLTKKAGLVDFSYEFNFTNRELSVNDSLIEDFIDTYHPYAKNSHKVRDFKNEKDTLRKKSIFQSFKHLIKERIKDLFP